MFYSSLNRMKLEKNKKSAWEDGFNALNCMPQFQVIVGSMSLYLQSSLPFPPNK